MPMATQNHDRDHRREYNQEYNTISLHNQSLE
jgi:hypothetical protein